MQSHPLTSKGFKRAVRAFCELHLCRGSLWWMTLRVGMLELARVIVGLRVRAHARQVERRTVIHVKRVAREMP